ncbi:thiamine pyrophosphate enzyme-like TPP-binding [Shewanella denitrificans OS217]|uniref:Thiamine pyrophosphate enzyme-like TPP-binding n=1 Tax=Shewanella denitrificans (strain OS217 / ATCC BAA-1090 / DSM 15013) TaxID=318161 RepID=Q12Q28_SHEDO|nr:thiamine pyrophosphate enzyme-like TPP-binding [Shewanella denitrificans OS217]
MKLQNITFWSSVPCSILNPLYNVFSRSDDIRSVTATSEGEAVGIASGAWLAGERAGVMMQNSGLGNAINPLTSLNIPFQIPLALMITWRGKPGMKDEPQHEFMGKITPSLLSLLEFGAEEISTDLVRLEQSFRTLAAQLDERKSHALLIPSGILSSQAFDVTPSNEIVTTSVQNFLDNRGIPTRYKAIEACLDTLPELSAIIATTGKTGRELFTIGDQERFFYQVGSMGCASAIGLGVALNSKLPIVIFDGDGAALMKLGNLATIGNQSPENLIHIIFDNGVYDSTGGQFTHSQTTDFAEIAKACGYCNVYRANSIEGLRKSVTNAVKESGPNLIHMKIAPGSLKNLARPTVSPSEVAFRFRTFLTKHKL